MSSRTASPDVRAGGERRRLLAALLLLWVAGSPMVACGREDETPRHRRAGRAVNTTATRADAAEVAPAADAPAACGSRQSWDQDGDGISDAIEDNNRPFGHAFSPSRCDRDPSRPVGAPASGSLSLGVNLRDRGPGYLHVRGTDPVDGDDWGTLPLVACIEDVGRSWESTLLAVTVTDLSLRAGGLFRPHSSHQNGLDVDVRYIRADGRAAPLDIRLQPDGYDPVATRGLIEAFIALCPVHVIFTDLDFLQFTNEDVARPVLMTARGHTNHFHVRLKGAAP
jgi:hypothetical protein